jgi:tetratricopeptide (TPR) repeat protein
VDSQNAAPRLLEFQRLIPDSVGIAMRSADPADFLGWVRSRLLRYAPPNSLLHTDSHLSRAMAFAWARAVWNGLVQLGLPQTASERSRAPAPAARKPMPEPGHSDPCPCGSGKKFQHCCLPIPLMAPLTQDVLWPYVLANIPPPEREDLLSSSRIPRGALIEFAAHLLDMRRGAEVIAAVAPRLAAPERYHDEDTAILLHLLCEAYGMCAGGARHKLKLLREITERAPASPLRSEAWQRLATIYMDRGDSESAWSAFRNAEHDNPQADEICVLEVELLVADQRMDEAKQRAREWTRALSGYGVPEDDPRIEFLARMAINPLGKMRYEVQGAGGSLREWLLRVGDRAPPPHQLIPTSTHCRFALETPPQLLKTQQLWHDVFPLGKPFSAQDQPFGGGGVWEPRIETQWCEFLREHPEAFDSLDILDDLATAVGRHAQAQSPWVEALLLSPLLERSAELLDAACRDAGQVVLPWSIDSNRPALRGLYRLFQQQLGGNRPAARATAEKLLRLNPADDHGVGSALENLRTLSDQGGWAADHT